ncbi:MAG TPA: pyridoxal-phosphate dependent enzyme [Chloroflexi bacterium]|nr:pyridoxal-phosphate dependent enzyme [Chloroflexota bacterium]
MHFTCSSCGRSYPLDTRKWRCECGGYFLLAELKPFRPQEIEEQEHSLWRYRAMLPPVRETVTMGEGFTPLVKARRDGASVYLKLEFLAPTGSFKDRGTTVLVSHLKSIGVEEVVEDSSGNAGASLAAYCARAGIKARIYVPAHASPPKRAQIAVYRAELVTVEGPREKAAEAVREAADRGFYYASHYYNPLIIEGMKTVAYELWEQLGRAPDNVVLPVGHGTLLLGIYKGFKEIQEAGLIPSLPRLFGVQSLNCAPLYEAFKKGAEDVGSYVAKPTLAEGISIARPLRAREILAAVRATGGEILAVEEERILRARDDLASMGFYVELTSAVPLAGLSLLNLPEDQLTVIPLTGSGLKACCEEDH